MKSLFSGLLIAAGIAVLAVGVLAGVEVLLANPNRRPRRSKDVSELEEIFNYPFSRPTRG